VAPRPPAVARVLERVTATVRRHGLIEPGSTVLVAVSGGADSLCMLHALHALRRLLKVRLAVVHVDHGARPGSSRDARFVVEQAEALRVPVLVERIDDAPPKGASPEAWWRTARYAAFAHALHETDAAVVATAHTQDDQAETVLLGLVRGGGLDAVAGIPPVRGRVVRPLLDVTRAETRAFCRALGLRARRDPANADRRYLRSAIRMDVLPALEKATGRGVKATIARTADALRADVRYLDEVGLAAWHRVTRTEKQGIRIDAHRLAELPEAIAARVVMHSLRALDTEPTRAHVDALLDLAAGRSGRQADLPGALIARRDTSYVRLSLLPRRRPARGAVPPDA
jgi:tRNA(Ile)-lysidine synthase